MINNVLSKICQMKQFSLFAEQNENYIEMPTTMVGQLDSPGHPMVGGLCHILAEP